MLHVPEAIVRRLVNGIQASPERKSAFRIPQIVGDRRLQRQDQAMSASNQLAQTRRASCQQVLFRRETASQIALD